MTGWIVMKLNFLNVILNQVNFVGTLFCKLKIIAVFAAVDFAKMKSYCQCKIYNVATI